MSDEELYFSKLDNEKNEERILKMSLREDLISQRDEFYTIAKDKILKDKLLRVFLGYIYKFSNDQKEKILTIVIENEASFLEIFDKKLENFDEILENLTKQTKNYSNV